MFIYNPVVEAETDPYHTIRVLLASTKSFLNDAICLSFSKIVQKLVKWILMKLWK